jgi:hypothetical protein
MDDGVSHERIEDCRTGTFAASVRCGRHAPYPPSTRLAVGCYESDGDECATIERRSVPGAALPVG